MQHQAGLFSKFCFIAHNCRKGLLKSEAGRSGFTQNFDSGSGSWSGRKLQNPAGVDSVPLDPWPPLPPNMHCNYTLYSEQKNLLTITYSPLYTTSSFALGRSTA